MSSLHNTPVFERARFECTLGEPIHNQKCFLIQLILCFSWCRCPLFDSLLQKECAMVRFLWWLVKKLIRLIMWLVRKLIGRGRRFKGMLR